MTHTGRKRVAITGGEGAIGLILQAGLSSQHQLLSIDKSASGVGQINIDREFDKLTAVIANYDVIIHLAWDMREDYPKELTLPTNKAMAENMFQAAIKAKVPRVIIASSVHADSYSDGKPGENIHPTQNRFPDSPYGASKLYIENLGHYFAHKHGLEVICIRFGGVNEENEVRFQEDPLYDRVLLYHEDCIELVDQCITVDNVPENFAVLYAVSNNINRVHSLDNFLNWKPHFPK
ncbi:MAG: NAD(P)-dependent oxidoreductase [Candidatus Kerfeldbacteria bacterium]|nr:NAD(P)-dependent oxidoreductase [Candidatus Kerfeldbacteria bacterium]